MGDEGSGDEGLGDAWGDAASGDAASGDAALGEAGPTDRDGCGFRNSSSTYPLLKEHVQMALQAGLKVIFNPLHLMRSLDINEQTLRWVWATVLEDFPLDEFPAHIARGLSEALGAAAA